MGFHCRSRLGFFFWKKKNKLRFELRGVRRIFLELLRFFWALFEFRPPWTVVRRWRHVAEKPPDSGLCGCFWEYEEHWWMFLDVVREKSERISCRERKKLEKWEFWQFFWFYSGPKVLRFGSGYRPRYVPSSVGLISLFLIKLHEESGIVFFPQFCFTRICLTVGRALKLC